MVPVPDPSQRLEISFPPVESRIATVRHALSDILRECGCAPATADDARLIVSELVANAVEHSRTVVAVRLYRHDDLLRVEVDDNGAGWPRPEMPDPDLASGRGLLIVDGLARRWGVAREPGPGKTIWAEIAC